MPAVANCPVCRATGRHTEGRGGNTCAHEPLLADLAARGEWPISKDELPALLERVIRAEEWAARAHRARVVTPPNPRWFNVPIPTHLIGKTLP